MNKIFLMIILVCMLLGCSKDIVTSPEPEDEITEFDLLVKNPNADAAEIYVYSQLAGTAPAYSHRMLGTFSCAQNVHLEAHYPDTVISRDISTEHWRKPSYTFYLPER